MNMQWVPESAIEDVCAYLWSIRLSEIGAAEYVGAGRGRSHFAQLQEYTGRGEETSGWRARGGDAEEGDNAGARKEWERRDPSRRRAPPLGKPESYGHYLSGLLRAQRLSVSRLPGWSYGGGNAVRERGGSRARGLRRRSKRWPFRGAENMPRRDGNLQRVVAGDARGYMSVRSRP